MYSPQLMAYLANYQKEEQTHKTEPIKTSKSGFLLFLLKLLLHTGDCEKARNSALF